MHCHFVFVTAVIESNIRVMQKIVGKPLLDVFLTVAGTDYKLGVTIVGIGQK